VLGISTEFVDQRGTAGRKLPQQLAVFAQGTSAKTYALDKFTPTSHPEVGAKLGYGSPAHLIARELWPDNGDGIGTVPVTFYPVDDDYDGGATRAVGSITPSGTQTKISTYRARIAGVLSEAFSIAASASVATRCASITAAINSVLEMPVIAYNRGTRVDVDVKWLGASGNDVGIEIIGDTTLGTTFALVQPTGGALNPTLDDALAKVGTKWETMGICAYNHDDTTSLDAIKTWGEGRWGELVHKPLVVFYGCNDLAVADVTEHTTSRNDDRVTCQIAAPGSPALPCMIAARAVARIARLANNNPPHDYGSQRLTGIVPGEDEEQWTYLQRDAIVKAGSSTTEIKDGVINLADVITPWSPEGEALPAYRYVVDIVKLQQVIYNLELEFSSSRWDGAPFIPDNQPTTNRTAKKPKMVKAAANGILQALGDDAVLSDPEGSKALTTTGIDDDNPKRWYLDVYPLVSGNSNVKDVRVRWGFFFGTPAVVA